MHETAFSFSNLESPTPGDALPPGRHVLRGWVMPKPGGVIVDVRACVGGRVFPGVHGIPRADLATHFQTGQPVALAEFYIVAELPPGPAAIVLEALELEGRWSIFQKVHYFVTSAQPPVHVALPTGPLRWHEYGRALQIFLRAQRREPARSVADLAREVSASIPYPRDLRHPHLPFHGHLDEPAAVTRCGFGRTAVLGYLIHETQPIKRVLATFDLQAWQTIEHTLPSPGPGAHFPSFANAKNCGLFGIIDVPAQLPVPVTLRLYAELADGSLHLCPVQRSLLFTNEDEKAPYPPQSSARFATTHAALQAALQERGVEVVFDAEMEAELARLAADFTARAPQTLPAVPPLQPAPLTSTAPAPRRVLLVSHNLNLEGAPLFLVDYARHLASLGSQLTVLSPSEGPLRARFEELGAKVQLSDATAIFAAQSTAAAHTAIRALAAAVDFAAADLVVCNTFTTFWAVHAAKAAGRRVLLYVHESTTPASFYLGRVHAGVIALVDEAFGLADCVSFTTASTRSYHLDYGRPANHRLTPGWIDVARIDAWRAAHPREGLRTGFQLKPGELLVTNVGSVCDRKGQHIFIRAIELLKEELRFTYPERKIQYVMVGARAGMYLDTLKQEVALHGLDQAVFVPETGDIFDFYRLADIFVCTSFEESFPRVLLESAVFRLPIVTTNVNGIPEMLASNEAWLIPPGDRYQLGEAMKSALAAHYAGDTSRADRARTAVLKRFHVDQSLPQHLALVREATAQRV